MVHKIFLCSLKMSAVKKKGDARLSTAFGAWKKLLRMYPILELVQRQVMGYALDGLSTDPFLKITRDPKNSEAYLENIWHLMVGRLYNETMVEGQRSQITAAAIRFVESVSDLSDRLEELAMGLPEMRFEGGKAFLGQRLTDSIPVELQVHAYGHIVCWMRRWIH